MNRSMSAADLGAGIDQQPGARRHDVGGVRLDREFADRRGEMARASAPSSAPSCLDVDDEPRGRRQRIARGGPSASCRHGRPGLRR